MPTISLQDIQDAADKRFGPLVIELEDGPATLVNALRLSKAKRAKLSKMDDDDDSNSGIDNADEKLAAIIKLAATPSDAKRILAAFGEDLAALRVIVEQWTKSAQVGEASPSPS